MLEIVNESVDSIEEQCPPTEPYNEMRSTIIYVGSTLACIGFINNIILVALFAGGKYRNGPTMYLGCLAFLDTLICLMYLLLMTGDYVWVTAELEWLYHLWHFAAQPAFAISKIAMFCSTQLVVCATIERFLIISQMCKGARLLYSVSGRRIIVFCVALFSVIIIGPCYFEHSLIAHYECQAVSEFVIYQWEPNLSANELYSQFTEHFLPVIRVFIPFSTLILLNAAILYIMKKQLEEARRRSMFTGDVTFSGKNYRRNMKSATVTMIALITVYLLCNTCDLTIKIIEQKPSWKANIFETEDGQWLYRYATDIASVMAILNCFLRIFVYGLANAQIRSDILTRAFLTKLHYATQADIQYQPSVPSEKRETDKPAPSKLGSQFGHFLVVMKSQNDEQEIVKTEQMDLINGNVAESDEQLNESVNETVDVHKSTAKSVIFKCDSDQAMRIS